MAIEFDMKEPVRAKRESAMFKLNEAEKALYDYACECDVGRERERAFEIYERVRTAPRNAG